MKRTKLFLSFFNSEKAGGLVMLLCTILSLLLANSIYSEGYNSIWHFTIARHPIEYWINDGLMAIFFLLIGLELERELYIGELSKIKDAILPLSGAAGGMIIPAIIYFLFNNNNLDYRWRGYQHPPRRRTREEQSNRHHRVQFLRQCLEHQYHRLLPNQRGRFR
jgi:Na+/H+ antiporter NhaA